MAVVGRYSQHNSLIESAIDELSCSALNMVTYVSFGFHEIMYRARLQEGRDGLGPSFLDTQWNPR